MLFVFIFFRVVVVAPNFFFSFFFTNLLTHIVAVLRDRCARAHTHTPRAQCDTRCGVYEACVDKRPNRPRIERNGNIKLYFHNCLSYTLYVGRALRAVLHEDKWKTKKLENERARCRQFLPTIVAYTRHTAESNACVRACVRATERNSRWTRPGHQSLHFLHANQLQLIHSTMKMPITTTRIWRFLGIKRWFSELREMFHARKIGHTSNEMAYERVKSVSFRAERH